MQQAAAIPTARSVAIDMLQKEGLGVSAWYECCVLMWLTRSYLNPHRVFYRGSYTSLN